MKIFQHIHDRFFILVLIILCAVPLFLKMDIIQSTSTVLFIGKCISFCILVIGLDLIWGYTGILSLGHGLYFALGGYAMAMYLKLVATNGKIADFMFIGGLSELPLIWLPFQSGFFTSILILSIPALVAGIIGYFIFRNRVKGVYFSIISQALTWAAYSLFIALSPYTNGNTGITEIKSIFGSIKGNANMDKMFLLFYGSTAVLAIVYFIARFLVKSKFGKVLVAIRDGENRTYFSGYKVSAYKNFIYVLSAIFAGIGGAVFVNFNGSITPSQMTISYSIMMVIWIAIGGRGSILGAVVGVFLVNLCEYNISSGKMVEAWQYILGLSFCITIIYFKGGIVGTLTEYLQNKKILKSNLK